MESNSKWEDWEEELFELSEKYCQHDDRELNSCLFYIFKPVVLKALHSRDEELVRKIKHYEGGMSLTEINNGFVALSAVVEIIKKRTI